VDGGGNAEVGVLPPNDYAVGGAGLLLQQGQFLLRRGVADIVVVIIVVDNDNHGPDLGPRWVRDVRRGVLGVRPGALRADVIPRAARGRRRGLRENAVPSFAV